LLGQQRWALALPHPDGHKGWDLENYIDADMLGAIRRVLT
jgi:hypothetical protein